MKKAWQSKSVFEAGVSWAFNLSAPTRQLLAFIAVPADFSMYYTASCLRRTALLRLITLFLLLRQRLTFF